MNHASLYGKLNQTIFAAAKNISPAPNRNNDAGFRCFTKLLTSRHEPNINVQASIAHSNRGPAIHANPDAVNKLIPIGKTAQ